MLLVAMATGCSSDSDADGEGGGSADATASPAPASGVSKPAAKGGTIGAAGSPCALPVTFALAARWTAEAVDVSDDAALAELARQGPVEMACEIDAKPAGNIGYLRVWTADTTESTPREVLEAFLAADKSAADAEYQETKAGSLPAAEVGYITTGEGLGKKKERALAVTTPKGVALIHLGGMDSGEHDEMLPAFELAKKTLRAN